MTTTTAPTSGAADLLTLIEAYAEARHRQGHGSYNAQTATALQAVKDALAAGQAVAEQGVAYAALPEPLEIDWPELHSQALGCGVEDRGLHNRYECAEYGWQDGVDKCAERVPDQIFDADQMRAFADATHALRVESLAVAYCEELDKLSQRNYELRLASHGQTLRLLTQKEKDSLGRRADGMDGNEWDQWVQEKFAQVNGLRVQGGSYAWYWG